MKHPVPGTGEKSMPAILFQQVLLLMLFSGLFAVRCAAQCISTTAHSGTVFTSDSQIGDFPFSNSSRAGHSDDQYASANALAILFSGITEYLKITGFSFSVPPSATICGVSMTMECRATGITILATVKDNLIRLVKNGTVTGSNQAKTGNWLGTEVQSTYGGMKTLWGAFLTPQDVNSPQFGIAISSRLNGIAGVLPGVRIDYVSLTVYYEMPTVLPLRITDFSSGTYNHTITNRWSVTALEKEASVVLQRSADGVKWYSLKQYTHLHTGRYEYKENVSGKGSYYYRLQLLSANNMQYSKVNQVTFDLPDAIRTTPNPATDFISVHNAGAAPLSVYNSYGQKMAIPEVYNAGGIARLDIRALPKGIYILKAGLVTQKFSKF
jgi:hypothetical protein